MPRPTKRKDPDPMPHHDDSDSDEDVFGGVFQGEEVPGPEGYVPYTSQDVRIYKKESAHKQYVKDTSWTMGLLAEVLKRDWPAEYALATSPDGFLTPSIRTSVVHDDDLKDALFAELARLQFQCLPAMKGYYYLHEPISLTPLLYPLFRTFD